MILLCTAVDHILSFRVLFYEGGNEDCVVKYKWYFMQLVYDPLSEGAPTLEFLLIFYYCPLIPVLVLLESTIIIN